MLYVRNMESEEREILGRYFGTEEDTVWWYTRTGDLNMAPQDCVNIEEIDPVEVEPRTWFIHKMDAYQAYGGPEEGGWWVDVEDPIHPRAEDYMEPIEVYGTLDKANAVCYQWNMAERERRRKECRYGYTSVVSYRESYYSYDVQLTQDAQRNPRIFPHYE